eukprot:Nk52_evm41s2340 gene=Nk52_evmTU41s2340
MGRKLSTRTRSSSSTGGGGGGGGGKQHPSSSSSGPSSSRITNDIVLPAEELKNREIGILGSLPAPAGVNGGYREEEGAVEGVHVVPPSPNGYGEGNMLENSVNNASPQYLHSSSGSGISAAQHHGLGSKLSHRKSRSGSTEVVQGVGEASQQLQHGGVNNSNNSIVNNSSSTQAHYGGGGGGNNSHPYMNSSSSRPLSTSYMEEHEHLYSNSVHHQPHHQSSSSVSSSSHHHHQQMQHSHRHAHRQSMVSQLWSGASESLNAVAGRGGLSRSGYLLTLILSVFFCLGMFTAYVVFVGGGGGGGGGGGYPYHHHRSLSPANSSIISAGGAAPSTSSLDSLCSSSVHHHHPSKSQRVENLQRRVDFQEKTSRALLGEAINIQREIDDSFQFAENTWKGEKRARGLLQDHIRTITVLVRRLNREIESAHEKTNTAMGHLQEAADRIQSLEKAFVEYKQTSGDKFDAIDVRISQQSSDARQFQEWVREQLGLQEQRNGVLLGEMQKCQQRMDQLMKDQRAGMDEQRERVDEALRELGKQIQFVDGKQMGLVEEIRAGMIANKRWEEGERAKMGDLFAQRLEHFHGLRDQKEEKLTAHVDQKMSALENLLAEERASRPHWEERLRDEMDQRQKIMSAGMGEARRQQERALDGFREDFTRGMGDMKESLALIKENLDAKSKMMEEDLRAQIKKVLKTIVVL